MQYEKIVVTKSDGVGIIKLNNPKTMNALDAILFKELSEATHELATNSDIGAVILTGVEKAFCAGADLNVMTKEYSAIEGHEQVKGYHNWVKEFINMEKPTIAAVNGHAAGAGFCIALLCDIVIASEKAKFGQVFVNIGLIPDLAGLYTLPRLVGMQKAKELVFSGRIIDAVEANTLGIANKVVSPEELDAEAYIFAKQLADGPRIAIRMAKRVMNESINMTLEQLLEMETYAQAQCVQTQDFRKAVKAFLNKEKPIFSGK